MLKFGTPQHQDELEFGNNGRCCSERGGVSEGETVMREERVGHDVRVHLDSVNSQLESQVDAVEVPRDKLDRRTCLFAVAIMCSCGFLRLWMPLSQGDCLISWLVGLPNKAS